MCENGIGNIKLHADDNFLKIVQVSFREMGFGKWPLHISDIPFTDYISL